MEDIANKIKQVAKKIGKVIVMAISKIILPPILIAALLFGLIAGFAYLITDRIAERVTKSASSFISSVSINEDGKISTGVSADELWKQMKAKGYDVDKYLNSPKELKKLLKAELVTQLPDTREDVTKEIEWDKVIENDEIQGIIKFKRCDSEGNVYYLTYSDPTEFQNQVEIYNKTGSLASRDYLLTHFTLKKRPKTGSTSVINGTGSFTQYSLSDSQLNVLARICTREQGDAQGAAAEASLMANLFELAGGSFGEGADGLYNYVMTSGWFGIPGDHDAPETIPDENLQAVKAVLVQGYRTLPKYVNEHDCLDPPDIVDPPARKEDFIPHETVLHNIYGSTYTFYCFPTEIADPFGYTSEENREQFGDFCYEYGTWKPINGTEDKNVKDVKATSTSSSSASNSSNNSSNKKDDSKKDKSKSTSTVQSGFTQVYPDIDQTGYSQTYTSSTGRIYKDFKQIAPAPYAYQPYNGSDIASYGCGVTSVAIALSSFAGCEDITPAVTASQMSYTSDMSFFESRGIKAETFDGGISATEVANLLKEGKILVVGYRGNPAIYGGQHYVAIVDMDSNGNFMVLNPGYTMGDRVSGWLSASQIEDGMFHRIVIDTNGVGVAGATSANTSGDYAPGYQAIVATRKTISRSTQISGANTGAAAALGVRYENEPTDIITTTTINYEQMVQPYTLTFDLLWSILVVGQYKGFALSLADLAYKSDIEVSIFDNLLTITNVDYWDYKEVTDLNITGFVKYVDKNNSNISVMPRVVNHQHVHEKGTEESEEEGNIKKQIVTNSTQVSYALTKAHTWVANYDVEYESHKEEGETFTNKTEKEDQEISGWKLVDMNLDTCGKIQDAIKEVVDDANKQYETFANGNANNQMGTLANGAKVVVPKRISEQDVDISNVRVRKKMQRVKIQDIAEDTTDQIKFTQTTAKFEIKDSKETKPNFVTLFNDRRYKNNKSNILSAPQWLFKILEKNEKTKNSIPIIKYLLYKATGVSFGVTDVNEIIPLFFNNSLNGVGSANGYNVKTDTPDGKAIAPTKEQIKKALEYEANKFGSDLINGDLEKYWAQQQSTNVNALFGIAVSVVETSCGTDLSGAYGGGSNNMFSYGGYYNGRDRSGRDADIELFTKGIAGSIYFGAGKYTVKDISDPYCVPPEDWEQAVTAEMTELMNVVGIQIPTMSVGGNGGEILAVAQKCIEQVVGYKYTGGSTIPLTTSGKNTCDCSSFVSWVLYEWGYKAEFGGIQHSSGDIGPAMMSLGGQKIPADISQIQPGDILVRSNIDHPGDGHVEIYAGNGQSYNGGQVPSYKYGIAVETPGPTVTTYLNSLSEKYDYAVRMPKP